MRAEYTRRGGRYRAEERGALEVERESGEADAEDDPLPPARAPLAEFLTGNDALALKIWAESLPKERQACDS